MRRRLAPWALLSRWPGCPRCGLVGTLAKALSLPVALASTGCSGRTVGKAPSPSPIVASDGASYGGSFPGSAPPYGDDDDAVAIHPPPDDSALDDEEAGPGVDASVEEAQAADALPDGACPQPLGPGALRIDELMIASVAGSGDDGEWIEIASTLDCAANLDGLHGECPRGSTVATFDVTGDLWIPPRGRFVVADSSDPAINHALPGVVVVWFGHSGDVLRNMGSTITVSLRGALLDTVTYPSLTLAVGDSVAFPDGCDASERPDFTKWKRSSASWFPGFLGTPNAPNTDIECPP